MEKILVTGNEGFIGSHLVKKLEDFGFIVDGYDLKNGEDIRRDRQLQNKFTNCYPDIVIHLAALAGVRLSEQIPWEYFKTNILGLYNVLKYCKKYNVKQFLFASSSTVYGNTKCPLKEESTKKPISIYGLTKLIGEVMCKYYSQWFPIIVFRPFSVYGRNGRRNMLIRKIIETAKSGETFKQYGSGKSSRGYTNVHDLNDGIIRLIGYRPKDNYDDFNFGGNEIIKLEEIIELTKEQFSDLKVEQVDKYLVDAEHSYADSYKAYSKLGWSTKRKFKEEFKKLCS